MKYTVYKTTNLINDKIYIGVHKTSDLNDNYLGSGVWLINAIKKYGKENFKKEILFVFNNEDEMFKKEKEIVNESFIKDKNNYNLTCGGFGSWSHIDSSGENNPNYGNHEPLSEEHKRKIGLGVKGEKNGMFGKTHNKKTREFLSKINSISWSEKFDSETVDKMKKSTSKRFKGIPKSEEQKKKMSEAAKKRWAKQKANK